MVQQIEVLNEGGAILPIRKEQDMARYKVNNVEKVNTRCSKSRLKFMREYKGMTQAELADKSGINLRSIQNYEQGFKDINGAKVVTVLALAEALDCDVYEIINDRTKCKRK